MLTIKNIPFDEGFQLMQTWKQVNPDVVGYIRIPGTNIDYPVLQAKDNTYYEERDIYGQHNKYGVIYLDCEVAPSSRNTIIYGHNWTNYTDRPRIGNVKDTMFAQLTGYHHESFGRSHPIIQYANELGGRTYVVFGSFYTKNIRSYLDPEMSTFTALTMARNFGLYQFKVDVKEDSRYITLSTCTRFFGPIRDQRFVVMAREIQDGEEVEFTTTANPNRNLLV